MAELALPMAMAGALGALAGGLVARESDTPPALAIGVYGALILLAGVALSAFDLVRGRAGLWLEAGLLLAAAYWIGSVASALIPWRRKGEVAAAIPSATPVKATVAAPLEATPVPQTVAAAPAAEPEPPASWLVFEAGQFGAPVIEAVAQEAIAVGQVPPMPAPQSPPSVTRATEPKLSPAAAAIAAKTTNSPPRAVPTLGQPVRLIAPLDGKKDDLKLIRGFTEPLEKGFNAIGIWHYAQLAAWTDDNIRWFETVAPALKGRLQREQWIEQARSLASSRQPSATPGAPPDTKLAPQ